MASPGSQVAPRERPLPAWGAWIEIWFTPYQESCLTPLPAWGAWIEICPLPTRLPNEAGRSPHGERGLKLRPMWEYVGEVMAAPRMGSVD